MRSHWKDGGRTRAVDVEALGGGRFRVTVDGVALEVAAEALGDGRLRIESDGTSTLAEVTPAAARRFVRLGAMDFVFERVEGSRRGAEAAAGGEMESPMPGVVTRVLVAAGETVRKGQPLVAVEAMKMEHLVRAPRDGMVRAVRVAAGEMVAGGAALVELMEPREPGESVES